MCGRFALALPPKSIAEHFQLDTDEGIETRYNIAPTQNAATIVGGSVTAGRTIAIRRWGLIPHWSKEAKIGARMINARSETVSEKSAFRNPFKERRCLVPASGFYEWKREGSSKQPFYIRLREGTPLAFAGLWDRWTDSDGRPVESFTILTTMANDLIRPLHDRMPVIVKPEDYDLWLDTGDFDKTRLEPLLAPLDAGLMERYPVGPEVNSARNEDPRCVKRLS